jgi:pyruvate,water dikinase
MPRVLDLMEARSAVVLRKLSGDPRLQPVKRTRLSFARRVLRVAARYRVPVTAARALFSPARARRHAEGIGAALSARLTVPATASPLERLDFVERTLLEGCIPLVPRVIPSAVVGIAMLVLASRLLGEDAESDEIQTVLRALPHNVTTEMDLALWELAEAIQADRAATTLMRDGRPEDLAGRFRDGTLPAVAQAGLRAFLDRYGHRAVAEIDIGLPRWSDEPTYTLGVLSNYLRLDDGDQAPGVVFARRAAEAEAKIDELVDRARRRSRIRATVVRFALARARTLLGLRELPKYYVIVVFGAVRRELSAVGGALVERGCLESPGDVFFVDLAEARDGIAGKDLREIVKGRREAYAQELRRRHVPRVMLSDGTEPEALMGSTAAPDGALIGTPASAGTISGTARVILDPVGAHLEPGEILVAPSTDPGWTPLFLTAGGLVMEMGGANSHGAVVAREYGIPAVVGVPNATTRIASGQRVTVDGSAGTVTVG